MLRVIITSRSDPPLPLVRMRARGELQELRAADLRFTAEETQDLLHGRAQARLDVDRARRPGGADRGLGGRPPPRRPRRPGSAPGARAAHVTELTGNVRLVDDYLWAEAIQQQSPEVRSFLLRTAIFDRFNADLCDAVLGTRRQRGRDPRAGAGEPVPGAARRARPLVPLPPLLRRRAPRSPVRRRRRTTRSASCTGAPPPGCEAHDLPEEAIRHAVAGRDWDRAVRLLRDLGAWLYGQDRVTTLRYWLQGLPTDVLERDPKLCYWLAWSLTRLGEFDAATRPLQVAERAWTASDDLPRARRGPAPAHHARLLEPEHPPRDRACPSRPRPVARGSPHRPRDRVRDAWLDAPLHRRPDRGRAGLYPGRASWRSGWGISGPNSWT